MAGVCCPNAAPEATVIVNASVATSLFLMPLSSIFVLLKLLLFRM
jgi:hypothetical protein